MVIGAVAFIAYAVWFFIRNFFRLSTSLRPSG